MRPYLAIIKDSFREAMASRVLWILLALITLLLLLLSPVGYVQHLRTEFTLVDLRDPAALFDKLKLAGEAPEPSAAKQIWSRFTDKQRAELEKSRTAMGKNDGNAFFRLGGQLTGALNGLLGGENLHSLDEWKNVQVDKEARDLLDERTESLDDDQRSRLNLLLIESALPNQFVPLPKKSIALSYLFWETPAFPFQQSSVQTLVEEIVLPTMMSLLVGIMAVMVAIVVTAPIIPQMFEPGSLHLLLSKPVNRSLLFLSKFFGGCAFIFLNVTYLIFGLWLIVGFRFGLWNRGLLYCIPIFLFLFSIYYAVSALASVIWRNAIVSVVVTVLFWAACFGIGFLKVNIFEEYWFVTQRITKIIPAGDTLISVNEQGRVYQWDDEQAKWQEVFQNLDQPLPIPMYIGPLYDEKRDQLVGVNTLPTGLAFIPVQVITGKRSEGWRRRPGIGVPTGTVDIFIEPEQNRKAAEKDQPGLLAVSSRGLFRYADVPPRKILGVEVSLGSGPQFVPAAADPEFSFHTPAAAALNPDDGRLAVYSRGEVFMFAANAEGKYVERQRTKLEGDETKGAVMAFAGETLVVGREDGKLQILDAKSLELRKELQGEKSSQPRFAAAAPGGGVFAVVFQNGRLWLVDSVKNTVRRAPLYGQGDIYAATFDKSGDLLVADRTTRVSRYDAASLKVEERFAPSMSVIERVYRFGLNPLYTVFPKPGELDRTVQYVLTGKETTNLGMFGDNMQMARNKINPWRPVWSGVIFMVVMLGLACVYIERQEF